MTSRLGLHARFRLERAGGVFAVDVSLDFELGLSVLFGPSGAGKSSILAAIAGLVRPDSGNIQLAERTLFDGDRGIDLPPHERGVALVFQSLALFPHLSALSNVEFGLPRSLPKKARHERARVWLARMRVEHLADRHPDSFSGGEAQRVALARALCSEPRALLLDEPFSALDQHLVSELSAELDEYVRLLELPVVLVTHDSRLARRIGGTVTLLRAGRVEQVGLAREVLAEAE